MKNNGGIFTDILIVLIGLLFAIYGAGAILQQSFYAIDDQRYFTFADDGLITLRYGWNLAHGNGLVWNPGEKVEGITNTLWALQACFFSFFADKRFLPLAMKFSAVGWLLLTAYCFFQIARACLPSPKDSLSGNVFNVMAFFLPLSYSPLIYWSLRGMETSILAALISAGILLFLRARSQPAFMGSLFLGLSFAARPDSIIAGALVFGFRLRAVFKGELKRRHLLAEIIPFISVILAICIFRTLYYGSPVPNTYALKINGMSAFDRISLNGAGYIMPFIVMSLPLITALAGSLLLYSDGKKILFAALPAAMTVYTVYAGGDSFGNWRFLAPYVPYAFLALLMDFPRINDILRRHLHGRAAARTRRYIFLAGICLLLLIMARPPLFKSYAGNLQKPQQDDIANINTAIWLNSVLKPAASVGVFYAGSIPFYTDFYAIDFLGKSDAYIASLRPDKSETASGSGLISIPGHNKYDLRYSILDRKPTYVQGLKWAKEDITQKALEIYEPVGVNFKTWTSYSDNSILLQKESPLVNWEKIQGRSSETPRH